MRTLAIAPLLLLPLYAQDGAQTCATGNLLREWRGQTTGLRGEQYLVVRDADAWRDFWSDHAGDAPPKVDFEREMVVAAFPQGAYEIGWVRVTQVGKPGLSKFWVGLCPAARRVAYHIAVVGRSDLAVEFWIKDPALKPEPGREPPRGGIAPDPKLVRGAGPVWSKTVAPTADERREAEAYAALLESDSPEEREQATRGLLRLGACARAVVEPLANSSDAEVRHRAAAILEQVPTFDAKRPPGTREHAILAAREHLSLHYPDKFSNDPQMRWEDDTVRYTAGPHWEVRLRYL